MSAIASEIISPAPQRLCEQRKVVSIVTSERDSGIRV